MLDRQDRVEKTLRSALPSPDIAPARLHTAMRYAVLEGGKRVRPLLAYGAGELAGASLERVDRVAAAVEMIHAYSLVHDDMPAMDDDVLRRGKPTVHVEFDEATALLVGDSLQSVAFQMLSDSRLADDAWRQVEPLRHEGILIAAVMRLAPRKRPLALMRILRAVRRATPDSIPVTAIVIGASPPTGTLPTKICRDRRRSIWR